MALLTQQNRWLRIQTPLPVDSLLLVRFHGVESLSIAFEYQLDLVAEAGASVPFDKLLGQVVTVEMAPPGQTPRYFNGVVRRLAHCRRDNSFDYYRAEVVPKFWTRSLRVQSRIFQQDTAVEILQAVLEGLETQFDVADTYLMHNYCVQYRESDYHFANRLMEEEGIYYYFAHSSDGHKLTLADTSPHSPDLPGKREFRYDPVTGGWRDEPRIYRWEKSQSLVSSGHLLWDRNFQVPRQTLEASQQTLPTLQVGQETHSFDFSQLGDLQNYDYPGGYGHRFDGIAPSGGERSADIQKLYDQNATNVRIRMQREMAQALVVEGDCNSPLFAPGYAFSLKNHGQADGDYVLTHVEHVAEQAVARADTEEIVNSYRNTFRCIPKALVYRPPRRVPEPKVYGNQTATVVGPAGEKIFTDKYGRIKVQFHWDRLGKNDADSSCWVRIAEPMAGGNYGHIAIPRIGHEVVVSFLEGDPDQPLVVGSVYNADQMPPFPLPANRTQSGFKTHSKNGSANNFSGIAFEDRDGSEHVQLHAERDMTHNAENNHYVNVGKQHHQNIGIVHSRRVGGLPLVNHWQTSGSGAGAGGLLASSAPRLHIGGSGQGGEGEEGGTKGQEGPFQWTASKFGGIAANLELTFGCKNEGVIGMDDEVIVGCDTNTTINPFGLFLGAINGTLADTAASTLAAVPPVSALTGIGIGSGMGYSEIVYGALTEIVVGKTVNIKHGHEWAIDVHHASAGMKVAGTLYALLQTAMPLVGMLRENWAGDAIDAMLNMLPLATLDCWVALASLYGVQHSSERAITDALAQEMAVVQRENLRIQGLIDALAEAEDAAMEAEALMEDEFDPFAIFGSIRADEELAAAIAARETAGNLRDEHAASTEIRQALEARLAAAIESRAAAAIKTLVILGVLDAVVIGGIIAASVIVEKRTSGGGEGAGDGPDELGSGSGSGLIEEETMAPCKDHDVYKDYNIRGTNVQIVGTPLLPETGTLVSIQACGTLGETGDVEITGSRSTLISGGPLSSLLLETVGEEACTISGTVAPDGTIVFQTGEMLEPSGMMISGEEGITVNSIEQIMLRVLESTIEINAEGITLTTGDSTIAITPAGIEINAPVINITADAECSVECGEFNLTAGDISVEGGATEVEVGECNVAAAEMNIEAALLNLL